MASVFGFSEGMFITRINNENNSELVITKRSVIPAQTVEYYSRESFDSITYEPNEVSVPFVALLFSAIYWIVYV